MAFIEPAVEKKLREAGRFIQSNATVLAEALTVRIETLNEHAGNLEKIQTDSGLLAVEDAKKIAEEYRERAKRAREVLDKLSKILADD